MEQLSQQVTIVVNELEALKAEIITIKGAHASLHQSAVTTHQQHEQNIGEQAAKVLSIQQKIDELQNEEKESKQYQKTMQRAEKLLEKVK